MADHVAEWDCEAYGPEVRHVGALCFFAELHDRVCSSPEECTAKMAGERQRVFRRINELSAAGNPAAAYLEAEFKHPDQLLGGGEPEDD
jgi:hypothetical protein